MKSLNPGRLSKRIRKYLLLLSLIWTLVMGLSIAVEHRQLYRTAEELAAIQANKSYEKDVLYRRWASLHGGVYAPVTAKSPPNPYLTGDLERDIAIPSGRRLTLINPAYMLRQVYELYREGSPVAGHITSLKPIRPENAPDPWETEALKAFERGQTRAREVTTVEGKPYLRFMRPLFTEKICLKCHEAQGYREGDVRGGISIYQPMEDLLAIQDTKIKKFYITTGGIWLIGLGMFGFGAFTINRRILERTAAEEALRESERNLKEAQRVAHLGYWKWYIKTDRREWSEEMFRLFGLEKDRFTGDISKTLMEAIHPDDRHIFERYVLAIHKDKKPYPLDYRVVWPDGSIHWLYVEPGTLILDEKGDAVEISGISLDMTDRKRLEQERLSLESRLHRAEKMEALGQLAGGVAHDLNNVLGVLSGYSELLLMEIPEESKLRKHVNNILQSSQKGADIIQDLLTLTRRGVAITQIVNLNRIVDNYLQSPECDLLRSQHPQIVITSLLEKELLNNQGSPVHLEKTLMNLVSNAVEAITDQGEVKIRTENRYLDRPVRGYDDIREGDYVVLTVSDTGKGISEHDLGKIFEPFYTKKRMGRSGTGLGLTVVWGTVKDHHGYIDVQSQEDKGTVFSLFFPATRKGATGEMLSAPIESFKGNGETILVVDDVKAQREMAVDMLTKLGYRADSVSSGEEALTYLRSNRVDLIVLDMIMEPGMNGLETYRRIIEIRPGQKAIIASGFSETALVKQVQTLGAGVYVKKPYLLEKIGMAVRDELNRKTLPD